MRKILSLIICLLAVLSVCGCGNKTAKISPKKYDENFSADIPAADIIAAENERFVLKWDSQNERVVLLDKERDISWSYTPLKAQEKRVDADGNELNNHPQLESPILVTYYDPEQAVTDTAISSNASMRKRTYAVNSIENGLSIVFAFEKERISVTVDFILRNDSIAVTVDPNKITEDKNTVISVAVAPFFCSVQNKTEDSYLFFPSGSGALIYADYDSDDVNIISEEVFGTDARRPEDDVIKTITSNVRLPVYGAKDGERAVAAIIEKNAGAAVINANVGNATIGYSAVYATFYVRSYELVLTNNNSGQRMKYSEEMTTEPMTIGFYPLYDQDADYVGMAECYRSFLSEDNLMSSPEEETLVNLKLLGAAEYTKSFLGIPYTALKAVTTVENAKEIVSEVSDAAGGGISAQLFGFGSSGTDLGALGGNFKLSGLLGDKDSLSELSAFCRDNDISLYMDFDLLQYSKSSGFAKINGDSALGTTGRRITLYKYFKWSGSRDMSSKGWNNKSSFTLISRSKIADAVKKMSAAAKEYGLIGVSTQSLSRIAYSDHSSQTYYSKGVIDAQVSQELKKVRNSGLTLLVGDANSYAAANSTRITDAPTESSAYDDFDEDVPFYQIVFKGIIPISSTPVNLSDNTDKKILKCIESGCTMSFVVSYDYDVELTETDNILYYSSDYVALKDSIVSAINDNRAYFDAVKDAKIISHQIMSDGLRKTVFDNGLTVFINYSDEVASTPIGVVDACSYVFEKEVR